MLPVSTLVPDVNWSVTQPFWQAAARQELRFPRCSNCGQHQWYPRVLCRVCMGADFDWAKVSPAGDIYTFTVARRPFVKGSDEAVPFAVVQVHFDEAPGVTFITNLADPADLDKLEVGSRTSLTFHQLRPDLWMPYAVLI